jgi:hypothetical protein
MTDDEKDKIHLLDRSTAQAEPRLKPIILKYKKKNKKVDETDESGKVGSEKYSRGLGDIQRLEGHVVHVAQKATKALSKGMDVYEREREQSSREKTDGAIEDFIHNSAKATSAYLKEASGIPIDLAESVAESASTGSYRKRVRKTLKLASGFIRLWRI